MSKSKGIFKVEIRKTCKVCKGLITGKRYRTYCSAKCREKYFNKKYYKQHLEWFSRKRAEKKPGKIQCAICGGWYVQVCSHVYYKHKMTGREYKKYIGKDVKKGYIPEWYRQIKSQKNHETFNIIKPNLIKGQKYWFKEGSKKAGRYERSPETNARLKILWKTKKHSLILKNIRVSSKITAQAK